MSATPQTDDAPNWTDERLDQIRREMAQDVSAPLPDAMPLTLARAYRDRKYTSGDSIGLRHYRGDFYEFIGGAYRRIIREKIRARLWKFLETITVEDEDRGELCYEVKRGRVDDVLDALAAVTQVALDEMPGWIGDASKVNPADVLAFPNGLLNVAEYLRGAPRLIPSSPLWFSEAVMGFDFDPGAECPEWMKFLFDVFEYEDDPINLLQEWFGYCLTPDTSHQKALLLIGPPRSGKGTIIRMLQLIAGPGSSASINLSSLGERFGLEPLAGKTIAVCPDAHLGRGADSVAVLERLKSIIGEDAQSIDRKFREPLPCVRLRARFTIGVNEFPRLPDASVAMRSRLMPLAFPVSFEGREDRSLEQRLAAEAPGVLFWALKGLRRLRERGRFTEPQSTRDLLAQFSRLSSPVLAFVEDCCEIGPTLSAPVAAVWSAWKKWAEEAGHKAGGSDRFGEQLRSAVHGLGKERPRVDGARVQTYTGIGLKPEHERA